MGLTGPSLAPDAVATAATRQLLRAETAAEVRSILQAAVHDLGGGVVPADRADETALPVDLALGGGAPLLPTAPVGSAARTALERHVPGLVADARHALDGIARIDHLSREATLDSLTRLGNRTMFNRLLARLGPDDVVVAIDLDEFKEANDTHGHPAGDEVLRAFAACLLEQIRAGDHALRLGGDEFALVLSASTGDGVHRMLERLRLAWNERRPLPVTFSAGVAPAGLTGHDAHEAADRALYLAKAAGRGRTRVADVPSADDQRTSPTHAR